MRSSADDVRMTYVPADDMRTTYPPVDDVQMMFWMMFWMTYVIRQPNLQRNLTLVSSAHRLQETSVPRQFPVKEQRQLC